MEEMKNLVIQSLETKGVLGQIRANLRSAVFKIVDEQDQKFNMGCGLKWENPTLYKIQETKVGTLITEMMREFMEFFRMDYSLSIFIPECNIYPDRLKKEEILGKLGFSSKLKDQIWSKMQLPLFYYMLLFFLQNVKENPEKILEFLENTAYDVEKKSEEVINENIKDYLENQNEPNPDIPISGERNDQQRAQRSNQQREEEMKEDDKEVKEKEDKEKAKKDKEGDKYSEMPKKKSYEYEDNRRGKLSLDNDFEPIKETKEQNNNVNANVNSNSNINEPQPNKEINSQSPDQKFEEISIGEEIEENIDESYDKSNEKKSSGNIQTISQSQGLDGTVDSHALENCNYIEPAEKQKK